MRLTDGRVSFDLGNKAYGKLVNGLERAYLAPNPVLAAVSVAQGWIEQRGMSFERAEMAPIADRVVEIAARAGFREIPREVEHDDEVLLLGVSGFARYVERPDDFLGGLPRAYDLWTKGGGCPETVRDRVTQRRHD